MQSLKEQLKHISPEYRCDVRWWLAEGLHTDTTLRKEIQTLADYGFGAVEFLCINEIGVDSSRYGWGSDEWIHDTQLILEEATKNGLGASMTCGTNWSNANLPDHIHQPDDPSASKELDFTVEILNPGQQYTGQLKRPLINRKNVSKQELVAVISAKSMGERDGCVLLDENTLDLTNLVQGDTLKWIAPDDGTYLLFAFWLHGTGQIATPSVTVSYTVNYLDRFGIDRLITYWDKEVLTSQLRQTIHNNGRVQMYMDSLELSTYGKGGVLWGYTLLEEFQKRRGYNLRQYLPLILRRIEGLAFGPHEYYYDTENVELCSSIRNDFYQTITDLYIDNMLKPMQKWLHSCGMTLRSEISYGMPFEISQPGKYVDGIETESLEFASQLDSYRSLAGVAHLYNKTYSSETGATMMNYRMGLDFYTQIIYTQFAAGVTKTVLHGYSSICGSEESTEWPGHEGMWPVFSERFGERQPAFRFYKDWTAMIARFQFLLRRGRPCRDVAVLRLDYNFWNQILIIGDELETYETKYLRDNEGIYWRDTSMQNAGYSYDYFAPQLLEDDEIKVADGLIQPDGPGYQALVIYQEVLPFTSAVQILRYAEQGLPIIFANGVTESVQTNMEVHHRKAASRTPYDDGLDESLQAIVSEIKSLPNVREIDNPEDVVSALGKLGVNPRVGFSCQNQKILTLLREDAGVYYLFAYHYMYTDQRPNSATINVKGSGVPYIVDCWSGMTQPLGIYRCENGYTEFSITLQPGEAAMYVLDTNEQPGLHALFSDANIVLIDNEVYMRGVKSGIYSIALSDGRNIEKTVDCRAIIPLPIWNLTVESWDQGDKKTIEEDRGLGYVTREVYYETAKTIILVGKTALMPWKDISVVGPAVSGIGIYETSFTLPADWNDSDGAALRIGSTNGNAAAVYVNDEKSEPYNFDRRMVDITSLVHEGENHIRVEVGSTLANRLCSNQYYQKAGERSLALLRAEFFSDDENEAMLGGIQAPAPQDYGMTGLTEVITYKQVRIQ